MSASTALMVPREQLARIAGLNQALFGTINIIAPPLGALLIILLPMQSVLLIDVGTALIAITILFFVIIPRPPRQIAQSGNSQKKTSYWQDLRAGWVYLVSWPGLLGIALMAMLLNFLLTPASSLIPLLVTREYHGGAPQLALVDSLMGVGVILGGILLSVWGGFKKRIITCVSGIIGIGAGIVLIGCLPANLFSIALAGAFLVGFAEVMANGPIDAILQSQVEPDMQGRVFSLIRSGATAMSPLSLLIAGPVSDWLGVRTWFYFGGIICILVAVSSFFIPVIMKVEENRKTVPAEPASSG
jgi:DHA3 family macrolide efflux protein-like MFS transporter